MLEAHTDFKLHTILTKYKNFFERIRVTIERTLF